MIITCPYAAHDLRTDGRQPGQRLLCTRCGAWVLLGRRVDGSWYGIKVSGPKAHKQIQRSE